MWLFLFKQSNVMKEEDRKHLEYLLNLLTYDDLDSDEKVEASIEYIKEALK